MTCDVRLIWRARQDSEPLATSESESDRRGTEPVAVVNRALSAGITQRPIRSSDRSPTDIRPSIARR
jgi:hypothetical protein